MADTNKSPIHEQSHIGRLFRVLNMLQSVRYYSTQEIADALGTSVRTIHRYIDEFRNAGLEIVVERHCLRLKRNSHSNNMVVNLMSATGEWHTLNNAEEFAAAIKQGKCVRIASYTSGHSGTITTREVEPFEMTANGKYVWCYDPADGICKTFRPSRCYSVTTLNKDWEHKDKFRSESIDIFGFHGHDGIRVQIKLDLLAYNLLIEEYSDAINDLKKITDNEWLLDTAVYDLRGIGRFCLGLLGHIEIIDSPELQEHILGLLTASNFIVHRQ